MNGRSFVNKLSNLYGSQATDKPEQDKSQITDTGFGDEADMLDDIINEFSQQKAEIDK